MSSRLQNIAMKRKINGLIKLLSEAPEGTPAIITPNLENFDQQIKGAPESAQIRVSGKDLTFAKRGDEWFITGAGITNSQLRSILLPSGQKKLDSAARGTNVNFDAEDFIEPVKAVNFVRSSPGDAWRDNTPIEPAIIKKYMFGSAVGDIGVSAATSGASLVHRDENLTYVLLGSTFNVMAPGRDLSATNPLEAAKLLLINAGFDSQFNITSRQPPVSFIDIIDKNEELGLNLDRLGEAGALRDALKRVRTLVGKFADIFSQDDIKVNFTVTENGPALTRRKVVGRGTEALTASDAEKLEKTDYFKYERLPTTRQALYKLGKDASDVVDVTVNGGNVIGLDSVIDPAGAKIINSFGSALYLYIKGRLKFAGETQVSVEPQPGPQPNVEPGVKTPQDQWKAYVEKLLGGNDWNWTMKGPNGRPGGIFFEFNIADKSNKEIPSNYVKVTNDNIKQIRTDFDKIFESVSPKPQMGISVLAIATGDPIGTDPQNQQVSSGRVRTLVSSIDKSMGDVEQVPTGEAPWVGDTALTNLSAPTRANKEKLKYARFGTTIFKKTSVTIDANSIAKKFYEFHSPTDLEENVDGYRANLIKEIRRIIRETR